MEVSKASNDCFERYGFGCGKCLCVGGVKWFEWFYRKRDVWVECMGLGCWVGRMWEGRGSRYWYRKERKEEILVHKRGEMEQNGRDDARGEGEYLGVLVCIHHFAAIDSPLHW